MSLHPVRGRLSLPLQAAALLAALLLGAPSLAAQPGTVHGRVLDVTGAPVASAAVEFRREASSFRRGTMADQQGAYRVAGLPPGNYRVLVSRSGYRTRQGTLLLGPGETLSHDWVLEARPLVLDTVQAIAGSEVVISRTDTEFDTRISETALELLPTAHDPAELVQYTPGARVGQVWGGATQQANNYQLDGLAANHPGVGGDLVKPSVNWIESVEIRGLGAAAEYGNFQGGLININTKRGTNDFQGALYGSIESAALTGSNLRRYDVAAEIRSRFDVEAEVRGPLVRNRLFYYLAGQFIQRDEQVANNLWGRRPEGFYHPDLIEWTEQKAFGKLLWQPTAADQLSIAGGFMNAEADRWGLTGYERDAGLRLTSPTTFYNAEFTHLFRPGSSLEVAVGGFNNDERREAEDPTLPGIVGTRNNPGPTYQNPRFSYRMAPSSLTGRVALTLEGRALGTVHTLKLGGEYTTGTWESRRTRNGGVTWRPGVLTTDTLFSVDPATWYKVSPTVPSEWGGEIDLNADLRNAAVYLQDHIELGSRLAVSPGVRFGWWEGYITPGGGVGERFRAVHDARPEARLGVTFDVTGRNDLVVKAHAGRYHQSMFAQLYDRVEGGNVFTSQQRWQWWGPRDQAGRAFTPAQRDSLGALGQFVFVEEVRLNQTGPVENYRQPYVDQLVVGVEKQLGRFVKAEVLYVSRSNHNMIGLVDRNAATNYTVFEDVRVYDELGDTIKIHGSPLWLPRVYIPNWAVVQELRLAHRNAPDWPLPPGLTYADTARLKWDPDYVLTTLPDARRRFQQLQMVVRLGMPKFGGMVSVVHSMLKGNLDNVSGYGQDQDFGAGPFANPNQAVNFYGYLPNFSPWELKVSGYGELGLGFRGGFFWNDALGDHYSPHHNLSSLQNSYRTTSGRLINTSLFSSVAGQPVFVGDRGKWTYRNRSTMDLHLERGLRLGGTQWLLSADAFNVFARDTPLRINTAINEPQVFAGSRNPRIDPGQFFGTVQERQRPRSLRLGAIVRF